MLTLNKNETLGKISIKKEHQPTPITDSNIKYSNIFSAFTFDKRSNNLNLREIFALSLVSIF